MSVSRIAAAVLLAGTVAACASNGDVSALRNEVAQLRGDLQRTQAQVVANQQASQQAEADARAAADRAAMAEQQAAVASERAERIYNRGLRK